MDFSRDARGRVTGLTMRYRGKMFSYEKTSDEIPKAPEPPKRPVAVKLDPDLLDACVGHYEFAPNAAFPTGMKLNRVFAAGETEIAALFDQKLF